MRPLRPHRSARRPSRRPLARLLTVLSLLVALAASAACAGGKEETPFYLGGIQVNEPDLHHWVESLDAAEMNTVSVTAYAKQGDWDTANLWWDDDHEGVVNEIRAAEKAGLHSVLILRVALDSAFERNRFLWHGMIQPKTDAQLDEWFDRYGRFVEEWARIARDEGVDVLMIASEMNSLTSTVPVDQVPSLEAYYLDDEQQAARRAAYLEHGDGVDTRHLWTRGGKTYDSLAAYLDDRIGIEQGWARQVTGTVASAEPAPPEAASAESSSVESASADGAAPVGPAGAVDPAVAFVNARRAALERHWSQLIDRVRTIYHGPLGYAANFDQYQDVSFWDQLDVIGINAYFPLRDGQLDEPDAKVLRGELVDGWKNVLGQIETFRQEQGVGDHPVIFTELGYTRRAGATIQPWAGEGLALLHEGQDGAELVAWQDRPLRPQERALAIDALHEVASGLQPPLLEGILYWKLSTVPEHRDIEPFVAILGADPPDPAVEALEEFAGR